MSLVANIEHLNVANGIEAVAVQHGESRDFRGQENWKEVLDHALGLFAISGQSSIRVVVGQHTVVVQKEGDEIAAVALPTGHPIAKSLRRMIRRMAKKVRPPLNKSSESATPSATKPTAPGMGTNPASVPSWRSML